MYTFLTESRETDNLLLLHYKKYETTMIIKTITKKNAHKKYGLSVENKFFFVNFVALKFSYVFCCFSSNFDCFSGRNRKIKQNVEIHKFIHEERRRKKSHIPYLALLLFSM